jgi:siderophore synthetase component
MSAVAGEPRVAVEAGEGQRTAGEAVLRCFARETGADVPAAGGVWRLRLAATGAALDVPVLHRSPTGWHRFGHPRLAGGDVSGDPAGGPAEAPLDVATLAALVARESVAGAGPEHIADVVARVLDSARRIDGFAAAAPSRARPGFLAGEQALLHGHPFHPAAKSRQGLHEAEERACFPELGGTMRLHWFAARADLVAEDSALGWPATRTLAALAPDLAVPAGCLALPLHPWQARRVAGRADVQALLARGALHDLGPAGPSWHPTSSLRTVWSPDAPCQLKLSLGLRITNSRRENLRHELALGVRASRLLDAGLGAALRARYPRFGIVRDTGWADVDVPDGLPGATGFGVAVRENPFAARTPSVCLAGLVAPGPDAGPSALGRLLRHLVAASGEPVGRVGLRWLRRYLDEVVGPLVWLRLEHGVALEAHHQNTLVDLDADGWPCGGRYRDNQGWYAAASRHAGLDGLLPGFADGVHAVFDDALVDARLTYYLVVNNVLGLVGALGSQGVAEEEVLLRAVREWVAGLVADYTPTPPLLARLLEAPSLPCKANLLTTVDGRDELAESVQQQSVYVDIPNPIAQVQP